MLYGISFGIERSEMLFVAVVLVQLFISRVLVIRSGVVDM